MRLLTTLRNEFRSEMHLGSVRVSKHSHGDPFFASDRSSNKELNWHLMFSDDWIFALFSIVTHDFEHLTNVPYFDIKVLANPLGILVTMSAYTSAEVLEGTCM